MNDHPFLQSTHATSQSPHRRLRLYPAFLAERIWDYSLGEMAVIFGVAGGIAGLFALILGLYLLSVPFIPNQEHVYLSYGVVVLWAVFMLWLWIVLVSIGKVRRETRIGDADLLAMQVVFFAFLALHAPAALFSASPSDLQTLHGVSLVFEGIVIGFHILYFLLALCVWVRVPLKKFAAFAVMTAIFLWQMNRFG